MMRKYQLSHEDLWLPEVVHEKLVKYGDRRGSLVRRLSDLRIRDDIFERMTKKPTFLL